MSKDRIKLNDKAFEREETTDDEEGNSHNDDDTSSRNGNSSSDDDPAEMLVPNRTRRTNAGNKMSQLINSSALINDEFYNEAYGGFIEDDCDDNYVSPMEYSEDEVDSDFDLPEPEDAAEGSEEHEIEDGGKTAHRKQLQKHKHWVVARFHRVTVKENAIDAKTQQERLLEAKKTAEFNVASLKRFEEFEIERKKRQTKTMEKRGAIGPRTKYIQSREGKSILILQEIHKFEHPPPKKFQTCALTGKPAKYIDPNTGLPYADLDAYKVIQQRFRSCFDVDISQPTLFDDQLLPTENGSH